MGVAVWQRFTKLMAMLIRNIKVKLASEEAVYITDGTHYVELCRDSVSRGERIMFTILYEQARVGGEILLKEWYISKRDSLIELELSRAKAKERAWDDMFSDYNEMLNRPKRGREIAEERVGYIPMTNKNKHHD